jgi:hypothetical protein
MTERTSAKSRLIRPGMTIRSVIERTPCCSTSSASWNASLKVGLGLGDQEQVLVGNDDQRVDVLLQLLDARSAARMRRVPSNRNGLVTTPTVRMPLSRAALAITGAAPVPVPPPMPAAMNTMLQPSSARSISSTSLRPRRGRSRAASRRRALRDLGPELDAVLGDRVVERLRVGVGDDEVDP